MNETVCWKIVTATTCSQRAN